MLTEFQDRLFKCFSQSVFGAEKKRDMFQDFVL